MHWLGAKWKRKEKNKKTPYLICCGNIKKFLRVFSFIHQLFVAWAVIQRIRQKLKEETHKV